MNPILRAAANGLNRSRSEGQIKLEKKRALQKQKRKQEKEKMRIEALEREKKWTELGKEMKQRDDGPSHEESAAEKFQKELCWCIQQLELGVVNLKPNPKQAQEADRLLRILKHHKTPMAKKRQVMRATFGDYRSKMNQEEKRHAACIAKRAGVSSASSETLAQATFFRKSTHQRSQTAPAYVPSLSPMKEEGSSSDVPQQEGPPCNETEEEIVRTPADEGVDTEMEGTTNDEINQGEMEEFEDNDTLAKKSQAVESYEIGNKELENKELENKVLEGLKNGGKKGMKKYDSGISSFASFDSARSLDDFALSQDSESLKDLHKSDKISPTHSMLSSSRSSDSIYPLTSSSSSRESLLVKSQSCNTFRFNFEIQESDIDKVEIENSPLVAKKDSKKRKGKKGGGGGGISKHIDQEEMSSSDMIPGTVQSDKNVLKEKNIKIEKEVDVSSGEKTPTIEEVSAGIANLGRDGKGKKKNRKRKKKKEAIVVGEGNVVQNKETLLVNEGDVDNKRPEKGQLELSLGGGGFKFNFENIEMEEEKK